MQSKLWQSVINKATLEGAWGALGFWAAEAWEGEDNQEWRRGAGERRPQEKP